MSTTNGRKPLLMAGAGVLALAVLYGLWRVVFASGPEQSTNDAYVSADFTLIAPKVAGFIDEVLVEDNQSYVLFMDEPEISLHFEWQKQLIGLVLQLNPNIQIIMTTHSPAVVMDGWTDRVTDVNDITIS